MTPFRSEKNTNWEGAFRVPGDDPLAGPHQGGRGLQRDRSAASTGSRRCWPRPGDPDIKDKLLKGHAAGGKTFKVHLDGYNQLPYLTGKQPKSARKEFFYFNDDGELVGVRYEQLEDGLLRAARPGHAAGLGRAVHAAARAEDLQPARRSLRARRHHLEHVLRLVRLARRI